MSLRRRFSDWMFAIAWLLVASASQLVGQSPSSHTQTKIRFDAVHSHTWLETPPLPELYQYHMLHGLARAAMSLQASDWDCDVQVTRWDKASLQGVDAIVFNLCSADRPPFLIDEIVAIKEYVQRGGGVLFITDHTNCYFHNHVLGALMEQLEIELTSDLACDRAPYTIGKGNAWIVASKFTEHPITKGLQQIAFQSGGCVDPSLGIVFTSETSWADWPVIPPYGGDKGLGFYGDYRKQPGEHAGPLAIVGAKQLQAGRIVMIADQNCLGGIFLNYADNRRLWLQAMRWVAKQPPLEPSQVDEILRRAEPGRTLVWCVEPLSSQQYFFGDDGESGLYHSFGWLNKIADARATDRTLDHARLMLLPSSSLLNQPHWKTVAHSFLQKNGKTLMALDSSNHEREVDAWMQELGWPKLDSSPNEFFGEHSSWSGPDGQLVLRIVDRNLWTNKVLPSPESIPSQAQQKWLDSVEQWLVTRGLLRQPRFQQSSGWLEEMDRNDK